MADRKSELERKRKKVEELRKAREERRTVFAAEKESLIPANIPTKSSDISDLVSSLLGESSVGSSAVSASSQASLTADDNNGSRDHPGADVQKSGASPSPAAAADGAKFDASSDHHDNTKRQQHRALVQTEVFSVNIVPKELVTYSKEIQTETQAQEQGIESVRPESVDVKKEESPKADNGVQADATSILIEALSAVHPFSQSAAIQKSDTFASFLERTSLVVERALNETYDVTVDYARGDKEDADGSIGRGDISLLCAFSDDRWSKRRSATSLTWSPKHPELLLATYNANPDTPHEPDGVALMWNMHLKERPEFYFTSQSSVLSACMAEFHPSIVVGGTYCGQVVLWDMRAKHTPVQRTPLTAEAHTHPVYCVEIVGTQNAHNLVSVSNDGRLCSWSLDMLGQPQESIHLQLSDTKPVSVTSISFPDGEISNFVAGAEDGNLYHACRHGKKSGILSTLSGHSGHVTAVDFHPANASGAEFSDVFLSSSVDWSVKLWGMKGTEAIHTFDAYGDYVFDVQWSPVHPLLFATADGLGKIDVWNIGASVELPIISVQVENGSSPLNKLRWSRDGMRISVGDADGRVHVFALGEHVAIPRSDDMNKLRDTIQEMRASQKPAEVTR